MKTIRVIVSCGNPLFCDGITTLLQHEDDIEIIRKVEDGPQAVKSANLHPDVLILVPLLFETEEIQQVIHELKIKSPRSKILLLFLETEVSDKSLMQYMISGADGYIKKATKLKQLVDAIRTVQIGR